MGKILIFFGVLDVVALVRGYKSIIRTSNYLGDVDAGVLRFILAGELLTYVSLVFSAYFLIAREKMGIWFTYAQFPLRAFYMILSFGFLINVAERFDRHGDYFRSIMVGLIVLELARLLFTVLIHRKFYRTSLGQ